MIHLILQHNIEGHMTDTLPTVITLLDDPEDTEPYAAHTTEQQDSSILAQGLHQNVKRVNRLTVDDVMIPRTDIRALNIEEDANVLLEHMLEEGFSRYPVYQGTLDHVTGMVHIRDAFEQIIRHKKLNLSTIQHPCLFVSPSMTVLDLLLEMREQRKHMALVVDEFGGNDGLVTIEDLIEQIVGAIEDEHDEADDTTFVHEKSGTILTSARIKLSTLQEAMGDFLNEEDQQQDVDTLGGLVYGMLGRIPQRGELVEHSSGLRFEIVEVDQRLIRLIRIHHTQALPETMLLASH